MKRKQSSNGISTIPKDAVLLIPDPESEGDPTPYGIKAGYYNRKQMLLLVDQHKTNQDAIHFIGDMLETGNPEDDGFATMLRENCHNPLAIARIVLICKEDVAA